MTFAAVPGAGHPRCASPGGHGGLTRRVCAPAGASGPSDSAAPAIVVRPHNTSVVSGSSEATLECVANARYGNTSTALSGALCPFQRRMNYFVFFFFCIINLEMEAGCLLFRATL